MHAIFGIRHHGPGSARSVLSALAQLQPDIVLVEGPPEAEALLPLLARRTMRPPVALLIYGEDNPAQAVYYPFAEFSPEYQAIRFALRRRLPVRLMDLPQRYQLPLTEDQPGHNLPESVDPLTELARTAGYDDAERWWDVMVEQQQDGIEVFKAILEAMTALREVFPQQSEISELRERYMRQAIAQAAHEGYQRIAVICGAWHAPALVEVSLDPELAERLNTLPEIALAATWIPWSATRLSRQSGYGAGITAPGWYRFLWNCPDPQQLAIGWLTRVAQQLRRQGLDASPAQVIDAVRLAETVAHLRDRLLPDLQDFNEVTLSVLCHGNEAPMQLIQRDLIIGTEMGRVPPEAPMVPLQQDFQKTIARLKLKLVEDETDMMVDLRIERERRISRLLHRLRVLAIPWGQLEDAEFLYEIWTLKWDPPLALRLIERSIWGNTVEVAATSYALHRAQHEVANLPELTQLVHEVLAAELPLAIPELLTFLQHEAAATGDLAQMMAALPPLVNSLSYGDLRQTPAVLLRQVVDGLITRIFIGLPADCLALDDQAALTRLEAVSACDVALRQLNEAAVQADWYTLLTRMLDQDNVHGLLRGRFCRIVVNAGAIEQVEAVRQMRLALARLVVPEIAAAWLRGFLQDSGAALVHDELLLAVLDDWLVSLSTEEFERVLPLVRRTIATFEEPEIRHIGRRLQGKPLYEQARWLTPVDAERVEQVNRTLAELLGGKGAANDESA